MTEQPAWGNGMAWEPTAEYLERSRLRQFMCSRGVGTLDDWHSWVNADIGRYWDAVVQDLGLEFHTRYIQSLDLSIGAPWPEWFVGGGFNYVANALDRHANGLRRDQTAIIWEGDDGAERSLTYRQLWTETNRLANGLAKLGVGFGDVVGIYMPMLPETVIAVLACGKLGAIFTPLFSGFGAEAVASRVSDCECCILITVDGFVRRGTVVEAKRIADDALQNCPTVRQTLVLRRAGNGVEMDPERDLWWHDLVADSSDECETYSTRANDPYMIIHTSGTTGKPKGALHVHAGFPIKAAHDLAYCFDLHGDDVLFWYTDLGWMMGPWAIGGGLMIGATLMLFEGTPDYPKPDRLWQLVEDHRVTVLGVAPTAIRAVLSKGNDWPRAHDLSSLRVLGSTGETWNPDPWFWFFEEIGGGRCPIINYSGGTETGGGIVGCHTITPIKPCSFTGPVPGMDADVLNEAGESVRGEVGELVVRQPWVGMSRGFWRDRERFIETYWSRFPDVWVHGDWAEIDEDGFWFIRGRSDDTLTIAGKRIGPAEVESAAVSHPAVQEAAAIGVPHDIKGESVVVLCVLKVAGSATEDLASEIRAVIAKRLGSALRPDRVIFLSELPRTRNAKIMRRVIRAAYLGRSPGDVSALENPGAVDYVAELGRSAR